MLPFAVLLLIASADDPLRVEGEVGPIGYRVPALIASTAEMVGAFPIDRYGSELDSGVAVGQRLRAGLILTSSELISGAKLTFEYEHDLLGGILVGRPEIEGEDLPNAGGPGTVLRKLYLQASLASGVHLLGGLTTSQVGLGLVANEGASGWEPFGARFDDPRLADRVARAGVAIGPFTDLSGFASLSADYVLGDDVLEDDRAFQFSGRFELGKGSPTNAGLTVAYRRQRGDDDRALDVAILDLSGVLVTESGDFGFELGAEVVGIVGRASVAPTTDHPNQRVRQLGAALKGTARYGAFFVDLDLMYASGDSDPADDLQGAFRADPSFGFGLILFRQVLQAQTGRAAATGGDPSLVGEPAPGLERFPSKGSVTNTLAIFPRAGVRYEGFEIAGGALAAFSAASLADPLNTRIAGGSPRNALDGTPGRYLGTEIDLAVAYTRWGATLGIEGGLFFPGSAFASGDQSDQRDQSVVPAVRAVLQYRM